MSSFPETIPELLEDRAAIARSGGGRDPWLFWESETFTLDDVLGEVDRIAVGLADRGVRKGDVVVSLAGNRPETIFVWLAANRLGAIAMPINPAFTEAERAGIFALVRPKVIAGDAEIAELRRAGRGAPAVDVRPEDPAVALATSGTTGAPKAVLQTHRTYVLTAEAYASWIGLRPSDRVLVTLPLFHVNAQAYGVMGALGTGATLALGPKFSASRFWQNAKQLGATQVNLIGAMISILLGTPASPADRDHAVRLCYAALALPEERHRAFEERFGATMTVGYGLSESTFGTVWPVLGPRRYGSMGRLRQHPRLGEINRARVVRDDGTDAPAGEPGELWLSNPAIMAGYLDAPAETASALEGGWLHTGDIVRRDDDGFFTFVSRRKEMLRRRGENISAAEVEGVIAQHPSVAEVAVVGVPSPLGEDDVVAWVAPRPGTTIDVEALRTFASERLAAFKVPSTFHVRDALPRTATERIAKHLLK
ncbi:MAG: AMP-binding protein [Deltaproteobacteria bacterium]|nr:AMP-binding protein [Deltaproteobacteria bacterium]